jgi:hypothetical protein
VLVLDGSGSIGNSTFDQQIKFASELANRLNISSPVAVNGHRLAIIQYSEEPRLEIPLDHHTTV